ncbi:MAG: hypothetical protein HC920_06090 [Oscillatoriales cyanobacterium SM2_3_0]|nr:hypothetical protein [Oscillatoriales cyanobacterium SM2_3_0]
MIGNERHRIQSREVQIWEMVAYRAIISRTPGMQEPSWGLWSSCLGYFLSRQDACTTGFI